MNETIMRAVNRLARKCQGRMGQVLLRHGLSVAEQPFFMELQSHGGVTQEELTGVFCIDKAATARAVKSLEQKGLLTREKDPVDRRQNRLYPTQAAEKLFPAVKADLVRFNVLLTAGIAPEDLETAYRVVRKIEENLAAVKAADITDGSEAHDVPDASEVPDAPDLPEARDACDAFGAYDAPNADDLHEAHDAPNAADMHGAYDAPNAADMHEVRDEEEETI